MTVKHPVQHSTPTVSVVIPTIPENNYELVDSLYHQSASDYEVLIVSDNSLDICEARNEGMKRSNGNIIAHTDDDCRPPTDWIEKIKKNFESNPEAVILGGALDKHDSGPHNYIGANVSYKKNDAIKIGGYNSEFAGWRDDTEFGFRMEMEYGENRCMFDPNLRVKHIGPLRTNVDRELERKFRKKYPVRYYRDLYPLDVPFGKVISYMIGGSYYISPLPVEALLKIVR